MSQDGDQGVVPVIGQDGSRHWNLSGLELWHNMQEEERREHFMPKPNHSATFLTVGVFLACLNGLRCARSSLRPSAKWERD